MPPSSFPNQGQSVSNRQGRNFRVAVDPEERVPAINHVSPAAFERDSVFAESAKSARGCRPASPSISEKTTHARAQD